LGKFGDQRAVQPLINLLLSSANTIEQSQIINVLSKLPNNQRVSKLLFLLLRVDAYISPNEVAESVEEILKQMDQMETKYLITILLQALYDKRKKVQQNVLSLLIALKNHLSIEPLINMLNDKDEQIRNLVAWLLGELMDIRAVEPLIAALNDSNVDVQM